jgi:hypothetical protein
MSIRICIAVDTVDEALEVFEHLKTRKTKPAPQVMIDPSKSTDEARVFDPSHPPSVLTNAPAQAAASVITHSFGKNISPKWAACSRIGSDTKDALFKHIGDHPMGCLADVEHIAKKIKRTPDQTKALLQLLWDRREIKYDGINFAKANT